MLDWIHGPPEEEEEVLEWSPTPALDYGAAHLEAAVDILSQLEKHVARPGGATPAWLLARPLAPLAGAVPAPRLGFSSLGAGPHESATTVEPDDSFELVCDGTEANILAAEEVPDHSSRELVHVGFEADSGIEIIASPAAEVGPDGSSRRELVGGGTEAHSGIEEDIPAAEVVPDDSSCSELVGEGTESHVGIVDDSKHETTTWAPKPDDGTGEEEPGCFCPEPLHGIEDFATDEELAFPTGSWPAPPDHLVWAQYVQETTHESAGAAIIDSWTDDESTVHVLRELDKPEEIEQLRSKRTRRRLRARERRRLRVALPPGDDSCESGWSVPEPPPLPSPPAAAGGPDADDANGCSSAVEPAQQPRQAATTDREGPAGAAHGGTREGHGALDALACGTPAELQSLVARIQVQLHLAALDWPCESFERGRHDEAVTIFSHLAGFICSSEDFLLGEERLPFEAFLVAQQALVICRGGFDDLAYEVELLCEVTDDFFQHLVSGATSQ